MRIFASVALVVSLVTLKTMGGSVECRVLMECAGGSAKACRLRFKAAERISRTGTGVNLPEGGKKLDIPSDQIASLTQAFIKDYESAASSPGSSPAAKGNVGHMQDHFDFIKANKDKFQALGIDIPSLQLAMAAHDIGKGFLDDAITQYIRKKVEGKTPELVPFLRDFILSHELHSIARIPQVVRESLKNEGVEVESPQGKATIQKYSEQIMEAIRLHNGVDVEGDLEQKYPTLKPEERQALANAWWPANYAKFAKDLDLKQTQYGGTTSPLGDALNFIDRVTLTSPSAPAKLMAQNLGSMPWGTELIEASTTQAAQGNINLIKAQGTKLTQMASSSSQIEAAKDLIQSAQQFNENMIGLGTSLKSMARTAETSNIPMEAGTVVFQRNNGDWIRINGKNKSKAFIENWNGKEFIPEAEPEGPKSPVDILMKELKDKGAWPPAG
jgi:hypothetical protein